MFCSGKENLICHNLKLALTVTVGITIKKKGVGIMAINGNIESTLALSDGRKLAYQEYGDLAGYPILLFYGTPGADYGL